MSSPTDGSQPFSKWSIFGFTTTPQERIGPGPPYTYPALQVNLFFRVFLGFVSLFVTWVPARLLCRNGEFAGTVLCVTLMIINFFTLVNALIWRDDNVAEWYAGYGWCDLQTYIQFAIHTAFNVSLFEIMRGLTAKVSINRVSGPTAKERRRERIISALVIFTVPVIQVALIYVVIGNRYDISTLVGCNPVYIPDWIFFVFYILPTPIYAIAAAIMSGVCFYRYRQLERVTRNVVQSDDSIVAARQHRVRKKLYFMTLFVIIVVLPIVLAFFAENMLKSKPRVFAFHDTHFGPDPFNIAFISFTTSDKMGFVALGHNFIALAAGLVVFIPFGTTVEGMNMYRRCFLAMGLGYIFPGLRKEYQPKRGRRGTFSWWSTLTRTIRGKTVIGSSSTTTTAVPVSQQSSSPLSTQTENEKPSPTSTHVCPSPPRATAELAATQPAKGKSKAEAPWSEISPADIEAKNAALERADRMMNNPTAAQISRMPFATAALPALPPFLHIRDANTGRERDQYQHQAAHQHTHTHTLSRSSSSSSTSSVSSARWARHPHQHRDPAAAAAIGVDTRVWSDEHGSGHDNGNGDGNGRGVVRIETRVVRSTEAVAGSNAEIASAGPGNHHPATTSGTTGRDRGRASDARRSSRTDGGDFGRLSSAS